MKILRKKLLSVLFVAIIIFVSVVSTLFFKKDYAEKNTYNLNVVVEGNRLSCEMELDFRNLTESNVNELLFCLYPNAFRDEDNILNTTVSDRVNDAYPNGFDEGYINILDVTVNGEHAEFYLEENDQILKVNTDIKMNKEKTIKILFEEKLPDSPMRYGFGEKTYNFGNWYPILCPFENGVPIKSIYNQNGDPFYSECADYNVTITLPPEFRIASSGTILKKDIITPVNTKWYIEGRNIRDFAFIISDEYKLKSQQVGETIVYSYYLHDDSLGQYALDYAINALNSFNNLFGEYPYDTLSVAEADFYIGGMEYPNLVYINSELYNVSSKEALEEVVVHEVAHQWWYGIVGNNEIDEPWLDEGVTQYSVALYYENVYGKERYKSFLRENETYCKIVFEILSETNGVVNKKINRKSTEFEHWLLYDALVYDVSALMFDELRNTLGDELFFLGIKKYFADNMYKNATKNDLVKSFYKATGKNVDGIITPWLEGKIYWG